MNNWTKEFTEQFGTLSEGEMLENVSKSFMWSMINQWTQEAKKEERERIINEIENVVNGLFMNYEEKIDIMKERLEEFKTNK